MVVNFQCIFTQVGNARRGGEMGKKPTRGLTVKIDPKITVSLYNIEVTHI